jgi:DNA modification methylase
MRDYGGGEAEIGCGGSPEEFVSKMVEVFRGVRRILRDDGTIWLNLGDSYARNGGGVDSMRNTVHKMKVGQKATYLAGGMQSISKVPDGLKSKDLIGIPWRVALALQADGWYLRQDIIWSKPNPMPESVADRCTKSHEYIFLLSKKPHYYYDHEAIKEPSVYADCGRPSKKKGEFKAKGEPLEGRLPFRAITETKNKRSVWTVNTKGYKGAHFAVYPEKLITPCVLAGCPAGGTVFDPFTGSGTTAVVALKNGRNYIGTELNPEYIKIAEDRIVNEIKPSLMDIME